LVKPILFVLPLGLDTFAVSAAVGMGTATVGAPMGQAAVVELAALACRFVGESISDIQGLDRVK